MEYNTAMRFVMAHAQAEATAAGNSSIGVVHVFLGLLKLAELTVDDISPTSQHKEQLEADISAVRARLSALGLDLPQTRYQLRHMLQAKEISANVTELAEIILTAVYRQKETMTAMAMLTAILDSPASPMLELNKFAVNEAAEEPDGEAEDDPMEEQALLELRSEDWETRRNALRHVNRKAVLAEVLREDTDWRVRAAVTKYIYRQKPLESAALQDTDWRVRFLAVKRLYSGDSPVLAQVAENDPRAEVRRAAVVLLRDRLLLGCIFLLDKDNGVREAAAAVLNRDRRYGFTVTDTYIDFSTPEKVGALQIALKFEGILDASMVGNGWYELAKSIALTKNETQYLRLADASSFFEGRANSVYYIRLKLEADGMIEFSVVENDGSSDGDWAADPDRLFDGKRTYGNTDRFCLPYVELLAAVENARIENNYVLNTEYFECLDNWEAEAEQEQWDKVNAAMQDKKPFVPRSGRWKIIYFKKIRLDCSEIKDTELKYAYFALTQLIEGLETLNTRFGKWGDPFSPNQKTVYSAAKRTQFHIEKKDYLTVYDGAVLMYALCDFLRALAGEPTFYVEELNSGYKSSKIPYIQAFHTLEKMTTPYFTPVIDEELFL